MKKREDMIIFGRTQGFLESFSEAEQHEFMKRKGVLTLEQTARLYRMQDMTPPDPLVPLELHISKAAVERFIDAIIRKDGE